MSIITYTSILIIAFRSGIAFVGVTPDNHLELIQQHDLDFRPISIAMGYSEAGDKRLYITYNGRSEGETPSGRVAAYELAADLSLTPLADAGTGGTTPCSMDFDREGRLVAIANFREFGGFGRPGASSRGSVALLDEMLSNTQVIEFEGSSVHPTRQTNSHPHMVGFDPSGHWLIVADLGTDQVHVIDQETFKKHASVKAPEGAGPRHFAFHPSGRHMYVMTEMSNEVLQYSFDPAEGHLQLIERLSVKTEDGEGGGGASIQVSATGGQLFATLRGGNLLAIVELSSEGAMGEVSHLKVGESPSYLVALEKAVVVSNGRGGSVEIVVEDSDTGVWARQESLSLHRPGQMLRIDPQTLRK